MNKITGIIVGAVFAGVVIGIVVKVFLFPSADGPTRVTQKTGYMEVIEMDMPITKIVPSAPTGSENAAIHYIKAIEVFEANEKPITEAAAAITAGDLTADPNAPQALKALEEILGHVQAGAQQAGMKYLVENTSGPLKVSKHSDDVARLGKAIDMLDMLGDYYAKNDRKEDADKAFGAMFIAGWHMINERSHTHMVMYGMDMQESALDGMSRTIPRDTDPEEARKIRGPMREYIYALNEFSDKYEDKIEVFLKTPFDAGDVWNIADNDKDRAWRVQAILAMGMIKFTHLAKGNTSYNNSQIEKFLKSTDPVEKAAAEAAKAYTEADFNTAGVDW